MRLAQTVALLLMLPAASAACDAGTGEGDAGAGDATPDGTTTDGDVPEPAAATLPVLTPCPEGWRELTGVVGVPICEPFAGATPESCGEGEAPIVGEGCARVASPCPSGEFADGLPASTVYVLAGASDGDGSRAAPFGTIREGRQAAKENGTVALGAGTYDELVDVRNGVRIVGACPERTTLTSSIASDRLAVVYTGPGGGTVSNLTIGPAPRAGVRVQGGGAPLRLEGVIIREVSGWGIVAIGDGGLVEGEGVYIVDVAPIHGMSVGGTGVSAEFGGRVALTRATIQRAREFGVFVDGDGASGSFEALAVVDTQSGPSGLSGFGFSMTDATLELRRSLVERSRRGSLFIGPGATAELEDTLIRDALPDAGGVDGRGISIEDAAEVTLRRVRIADHISSGVAIFNSPLLAEHLVIHDVALSDATSEFGRGLELSGGASLIARRVLLERTKQVGIFASDGATAEFDDLTIRDTTGQEPTPAGGRGLAVVRDATVTLRRGRIVGSHGWGVMLGLGGVLDAEDLAIEETTARDADALYGRGIELQTGATLRAERLRVAQSYETGIHLTDEGTTAELRSVRVLDTYGAAPDEIGERGINVQGGARLSLVGGILERHRDYAAAAWEPGTAMTLEDVEIRDTLARSCEEEGCRGAVSAIGSYLGAAVTLRRFVISGSPFCGVHVATGGGLDLEEGEVEGCVIGACVLEDDYDLSRLTTSVSYRDNGSNLDSTSPPVPSPTPAGDLL